MHIDRQKLAGKGFFADMNHFRSSERLGKRSKVVEHTHKPQGGRRFQPSISFRSKVRGEKRFCQFFPEKSTQPIWPISTTSGHLRAWVREAKLQSIPTNPRADEGFSPLSLFVQKLETRNVFFDFCQTLFSPWSISTTSGHLRDWVRKEKLQSIPKPVTIRNLSPLTIMVQA